MTYKREKNEIYIPNVLSSPFPLVIRGTRHIIHNHLMAGWGGGGSLQFNIKIPPVAAAAGLCSHFYRDTDCLAARYPQISE